MEFLKRLDKIETNHILDINSVIAQEIGENTGDSQELLEGIGKLLRDKELNYASSFLGQLAALSATVSALLREVEDDKEREEFLFAVIFLMLQSFLQIDVLMKLQEAGRKRTVTLEEAHEMLRKAFKNRDEDNG